MYELPCIPILVTSEMICQWFSRVTKSRVTIIGKSPHEWPKYRLFAVTNVLFYFLYVISCPEHIAPLKNNRRSFISPLSPRKPFCLSIVTSPQLICDVTRTRDTSIVTSYSSIALARANWRSSLLNNSREYRFRTTQYSRLSVQEIMSLDGWECYHLVYERKF